jgi:hypothetical protein
LRALSRPVEGCVIIPPVTVELTTMTMPDGSRCFYVPELDLNPYRLRHLIGNVSGVKLTGAIDCDKAESCWFDFEYIDLKFKVHNPFPSGTFWFIAEDPDTAEDILHAFVTDLNVLLND